MLIASRARLYTIRCIVQCIRPLSQWGRVVGGSSPSLPSFFIIETRHLKNRSQSFGIRSLFHFSLCEAIPPQNPCKKRIFSGSLSSRSLLKFHFLPVRFPDGRDHGNASILASSFPTGWNRRICAFEVPRKQSLHNPMHWVGGSKSSIIFSWLHHLPSPV